MPIGLNTDMGPGGSLRGRFVWESVPQTAIQEPAGTAARPTSAAPHSITKEDHFRFMPPELKLERVAQRDCGAVWRSVRNRLNPLRLAQLSLGNSTT